MTVLCPDARPPAYHAAAGLADASKLHQFITGFYRDDRRLFRIAGKLPRLNRLLARRHEPAIPTSLVRSFPSFDLALAIERRSPALLRHRAGRSRTRRFDRDAARCIRQSPPDVVLAFSDVASEFTLRECRENGIPTVLSMVHGDVREESEVLELERERSPDFFPIYLGDGPVEPRELDWIYARRLDDLALSDLILVPSEHIARTLTRYGTRRDRISVVPYAADTRRFVPGPGKAHGDQCVFLFAGGITQRKGIKYLLEAWRLVCRPGWRLGLLGGLPRETRPLEPYRNDVEWLGRVGHAEMPERMSTADVFVFPSLFEGSAVVTYEALACGLPSIVTAEAGSVVRDGREGLVVPSADVESLAVAMERLGRDPALRAEMASAARLRAEQFDWTRYHASVVEQTDLALEIATGRTPHASRRIRA